ncbi:MAG: cell envelope integrity protein TolA [Gammaproteobacteria bacterium]|nr:cell envelope integrity protein TolA [Gammaproteobacteria bacterium]
MNKVMELIGDKKVPLIVSLVLHVGIAILLGVNFTSIPQLPSGPPEIEIVSAVAIDESKVQAELERLKREQKKKKNKEDARQKRLKNEATKAKKARQREEQRLKDAAKKRKAEEAKRKTADAKHKAAAKARQQEEKAERQRLEEIKQQQQVLEKKRIEDEQRLLEMEQQRKIEAEKKRQAEETRKRLASERAFKEKLEKERQQQLGGLRSQYITDITNKVQRKWLRSPGATGTRCTVLVNQIPGGEVVKVQVTACSGDANFQRSVEAAVYKASPLPAPPDPDVFDREIEFIFEPR